MTVETALAIVAILGVLAMIFAHAHHDRQTPYGVTFYGDSSTFGGYFVGDVLHRYDPDPVAMVAQASGRACINRARNGLKLSELLVGGVIALESPTLGEPGTVEPFSEQLKSDPSPVVVIGCGVVDAMFSGITITEHAQNLRTAAGVALAAGKLPMLRGLNRFTPCPALSAEQLARRDAFDQMTRLVAGEQGLTFLDIDGAGEPDICGDSLHPTAEYHQRIARHIAAQL